MTKKFLILAGLLLAARGVAGAVQTDAIIKSGVDYDTKLTIDSTAKAARVTPYNTDGTAINNPGGVATYSASTAAFTPVATATDTVTIAGSATKTIKVLRITLSGTQTTAGINTWYITKRSAADTGGTSVAMVAVPHDSASAAASATILKYTANPTGGGTLVGHVWIGQVNAPAPGTAGIGIVPTVIDFPALYGQPIILRGTAEQLAVNFNGAAVPSGLSMAITVDWTEE